MLDERSSRDLVDDPDHDYRDLNLMCGLQQAQVEVLTVSDTGQPTTIASNPAKVCGMKWKWSIRAVGRTERRRLMRKKVYRKSASSILASVKIRADTRGFKKNSQSEPLDSSASVRSLQVAIAVWSGMSQPSAASELQIPIP